MNDKFDRLANSRPGLIQGLGFCVHGLRIEASGIDQAYGTIRPDRGVHFTLGHWRESPGFTNDGLARSQGYDADDSVLSTCEDWRLLDYFP